MNRIKEKEKNTYKKYLLFFFLFLFVPSFVLAAKATNTSFSINGNNSVQVNNNIGLEFTASSSDGLNAVDGIVSVSDASCLQIVSLEEPSDTTTVSGNKFVYSSMKEITSSKSLLKINLKGLKENCSANITVSSINAGFLSSEIVYENGSVSKRITVTEPPHTNNYLSNLTVEGGSISFNKDTTNYSINVGGNVGSTNINAQAEDSKARVDGLGAKPLNYGDNHFEITVTAENGDKKVYTININRKDDRSGNNNLASLSANEGAIRFNPSTINYNVTVPFTTSKLTVNAVAADPKAKVEIRNNNLVPGKTVGIQIVVTAENGAQKTYTINARREQDPNKPKSNNNYLKSLTPSSGELSPEFNKEVLEYKVTVPYDVKEITFEGLPEDAEYGEVKVEGKEKLKVGKNKYKIIVTAEDSTTKEYIVTVIREKDPNAPKSTNAYLKYIKINGKDVSDFNKKKYVYYYDDKKIDVKAVAEDKESNVEIIKHDNVYSIIVTAQNGNMEIYTICPKANNIVFIIIIIILSVLLLGAISLIAVIIITKQKKKQKRTTKIIKNDLSDLNKITENK